MDVLYWFASYLFVLKYVVYALSVLLLIFGLDDLFIDLVYWGRKCYRRLVIYRKHPKLHYSKLKEKAEQPLAIMVPAWQEHGVVGPMAELAASTLDYENYHIFVGTYPNDDKTQADVDAVCARFPNVHKVVCARPGPTSKADCLNNIIASIFTFESQAKFAFQGFILHDAEDVLSAMEMRLFNYLVERKDLIQLPVFPFERQWYEFTSGSYLDEFAEIHGKDVPVREALVGQVPSAGVGTCFSRRAIQLLIEQGDGIAFDVQSLTEDYDIGFRLKQHGMSEVFIHFPVLTDTHKQQINKGSLKSASYSSVVCVREYFPNTFTTAVRQKSRWIIGIVFQGMKSHAWTRDWKLNYFLWRDRRGGLTNFIGFVALLVLFQLACIWGYQQLSGSAYNFLSIYGDEPWLSAVLWANAVLLANRMLQRFVFVTRYYGCIQGVLSIPRMVWGNIINFFANIRAVRQILEMGDVKRVAWDKTSHDFPSLGEARASYRPLGEILLSAGAITKEQLHNALTQGQGRVKLGRYLMQQGVLSGEQLAQAIAEQAGVEYRSCPPLSTPEQSDLGIHKTVAVRYAIIGLFLDKGVLHIASEQHLSPVALGAISRKVGYKVRYYIAQPGQVTVALKMHFSDDSAYSYANLQRRARRADWPHFVNAHYSEFEAISEVAMLSPSVANQVMIGQENSDSGVGDYLIAKGVIDEQTLELAQRIMRRPLVSDKPASSSEVSL
ncbi:glycosyl transferase family protein [Pseudoalteromonas sp. CNC9-20]|uniref:glycosyl transferase family protein n=1 Tax=Pseudoalteromonas sp. CNC9-20 TaxID=2917750 RepID=UPI001EF68629